MGRVLLVEDEQVLAELLGDVLRRAGHEVDVVHTVEDAEREYERNPHELVVTDLLLPDRTGLDLARRLSEAGPGTASTPIVLVTAYLEPELQREVEREPSIVEVVRKPMDVFQLQEIVAAHLRASRTANGSG